jgi:hypothetical protein
MNCSRQRDSFSRIRRQAVIATVACLLVRALIPLGYMPGNVLDGEYMVLCPAGLAAGVVADSHHQHGGDGESFVDADRTCPLGTALQSAALLPGDSIPFESSKIPVIGSAPQNDVFNTRFQAKYRSRAPPLLRIQLT